MRDYPCRYGETCKKKGSTCLYLHPGEPDYDRAIQKKDFQERRGGPSGQKRFADATASNTTSLPDGPNRWGKPLSNPGNAGGERRSSGSDNNASSSWNFSGKSMTSSNATISAETTAGFGNSGWGSTNNNNASASTSITASWDTGGNDSTWATSTNDSALGRATAGLGARGNDSQGAASASQNNGGRRTSNSGGNNGGGGWGASNSGGNNDLWAAASASRGNASWGTSDPGGNNTSGTWGSSTTHTRQVSNETISTFARANDQPTTSGFGSWGSSESVREKSSDAHKDKGEGKKSGDIQMRDPSPPRKVDNPKPKIAPLNLSSSAKPMSESLPQQPLSPKYRPPLSAVSTKFPSEFKSSALEVAKPTGPGMKIKGAEGRMALYKSIIKHARTAIIAFIDRREAQTDLSRWKDTQNSTIYQHSTQKTRKLLDSERANYHRRLQEIEEAFQNEINALVSLPEWSTTNKKKNSTDLSKETIALYTRELQEWFKDLELHKRLLMEEKPEEKEEGEIEEGGEGEEGEVNDAEEEMAGQSLTELLQRGHWIWKELIEITDSLEARFEEIQTGVYFDIFTCIDDESRAKLTFTSASLETIGQEEAVNDELPAISERIATVGKSLRQQSEELVRLLSEVAEQEKKVETVRLQTKEASSVYQVAEHLFEDFEKWKEGDDAQISVITEKIKLLRLPNPSISSTSRSHNAVIAAVAAVPPDPSQPAPEPISAAELIDPIRQLVVDAIQKELKLYFDGLRSRCLDNQQKLETEIEREAKRIMLKAVQVKSKIMPSPDPSTSHLGQTNMPSDANAWAPN